MYSLIVQYNWRFVKLKLLAGFQTASNKATCLSRLGLTHQFQVCVEQWHITYCGVFSILDRIVHTLPIWLFVANWNPYFSEGGAQDIVCRFEGKSPRKVWEIVGVHLHPQQGDCHIYQKKVGWKPIMSLKPSFFNRLIIYYITKPC